jgi:hypothetical protein
MTDQVITRTSDASGETRGAVASSSRWLVALLGLYAVALVALVLLDSPLGPDEAIYASGGRVWLGDGPSAGFTFYRPLGMKLIAALGLLLGGADATMRVVPVLLTLAFLACSWRFALALSGRVAAHVLAVATLTWSHLPWRGMQLLSDVPSALGCLGMVWFLLRLLRPDGSGTVRHAVAAAVCGGAAFWFRYGALAALVCVVVAFAALWPARIWAKRWPMLVFAALLTAGLVPFVLFSMRTTGRWDGVLELAADTADRRFVGDGLVTYLRGWFGPTAGPLLGSLALVGLVAGARDLLSGRRGSWRAVMALAGAGQIVWLGLTIHGEPRYVFFPILLLSLSGADAVAGWLGRTSANVRRFAIAGGLTVAGLAVAVVFALTVRTIERMEEADRIIEEQARVIRLDAGDAACLVFSNRAPQVSWYSGCRARVITATRSAAELPASIRLYLLAFDRRGQPAAAVAQAALRDARMDAERIGDESPRAFLVRLRPR